MGLPALQLETLGEGISQGNFADAVLRARRSGHDPNSPEYWEAVCSALVEVARERLDQDPTEGLIEEFDAKLLSGISAVEVDQVKKFVSVLKHGTKSPFPDIYKQFEQRLWRITSAVRRARRGLLSLRQEHPEFSGVPHPIQSIEGGLSIDVELMSYGTAYTFDFQGATLLAIRTGEKEAAIYELPPVQAVMGDES